MIDAPAEVERVLVVPRAVVVPGDGWLGIRSDDSPAILAADRRDRPVRAAAIGRSRSWPEAGHPVSRPARWPALVPDAADPGRGDGRLHDRWSIGVGGHLNPGDRDIAGGLRREWHEELVADFTADFRFVGLLNDDTTEVGRVHLGVVFTADAAGRPVAVRETDKLTGGFVDTAGIEAVRDRLESWSRIVFEHLAPPAQSG